MYIPKDNPLKTFNLGSSKSLEQWKIIQLGLVSSNTHHEQ